MECDHCDRIDCPACGGTGSRPGAGAVVRSQPVERVEVADVEVEYVEREPGFPGWQLMLSIQTLQTLGLHRWHQSEQTARDALGLAVLAHLMRRNADTPG